MTNNQAPALIQKDITDQVNGKLVDLKKEGLMLPDNYSASNALKSAFFAMTNSTNGNLLEKCSKESIANTLLDMVVQGLTPAKTQCYFIPYGNNLKLNRSYFGTQAVVKRLTNVTDIWANVIYKGDDFVLEIDKGREKLVQHDTKFENRDNEIIGAYAIVEKTDGTQVLTTMTRKEIDSSWSNAKTKNVQNKFPQEMAKRTVINRAAKAFINTSDDSDLLTEAINKTTENEYMDQSEIKEADVVEEINNNANIEEFEPQAEVEIIDAEPDKKEVNKEEIFQRDPELKNEPKKEADPF
ncbi:recombinase RecT [Carnobacterium divergens]|uniref:recombinase RecT n=1 Tax=Carnobacterium divergens TaxID=2748 RepID=UPI0039C8FD86